MDIITLLKADHKEVAAMLKKILKSSDRAIKTRQATFTKMYNALTVHADFEEKVFYPAVKETAKTKNLVLEAYEEHHLIKILLSELKNLSPSDESWKAKVTVLEEVVKHHVKEEEKELFPKTKRILNKEELKVFGEKYLEIKDKENL